MFAFIKNILFNKNNLRKDIEFVHHKPKIYNIGDDFCSPKHYFKFENPINNLTIIGGGIYPLLAKKYIKKNNLRRNQIVLWGIGESNSKNSNIEKLFIDKNFIQIGVRDISSVSKEYFLPCVSCLDKMLDLPILKNNTVVFLNRDIDVTNIIDDELKKVLLNKQWNLAFNNCNYDDFKDLLQNNNHIITNSYHGAYWGLLSGHYVTIIGYSTKFISLLKMFNFDETYLIKVKRGDNELILNALCSIDNLENAYKLDNSKLILDSFRELNVRFANELINKSIIENYQLI